MNTFMKRILIATVFGLTVLCTCSLNAKADALDHIHSYNITVDVEEDGTADITYELSWEVLDSDSYGPLDWAEVGLPNNNCNSIEPITDNIDYVYTEGSFAKIYFNESHYKGDIVDFAYRVNMDHMYLMDLDSGYTEYNFTPGWFDEIEVDSMVIKWNAEKAELWAPNCLVKDGYYTWEYSNLSPGETKTVSVSYPNDAYSFVEWEDNSSDYYYDDYDDGYDFSEHSVVGNIFYVLGIIIGGIFILALMFCPILIPIGIAVWAFNKNRGFTTKETKVTRTKIEYYPTCPGCGAARVDGFDNCQYCGRDMIKSKETITEEQIPKEEKEKVMSYKTDGTYRYTSDPNTYVRVHSVVVPVHHAAPKSSGSGSSSSHHSSCVHSSCAHSSCACACACACAGGGRAGCTTKDFYNTNLKLKYLKRKKK